MGLSFAKCMIWPIIDFCGNGCNFSDSRSHDFCQTFEWISSKSIQMLCESGFSSKYAVKSKYQLDPRSKECGCEPGFTESAHSSENHNRSTMMWKNIKLLFTFFHNVWCQRERERARKMEQICNIWKLKTHQASTHSLWKCTGVKNEIWQLYYKVRIFAFIM